MKIPEILLEVADLTAIQKYTGMATAGTTSSLTDTSFQANSGVYANGTLFILSGTYAGKMKRITSQAEGTVQFSPECASAIAAGTEYMVADGNQFKTSDYRQAMNKALRSYDILDYDTSMTFDFDVDYLTLPAGVTDIRTVEIAMEDASPYRWKVVPSRFIRDDNSTISIIGGVSSYDTGRKIRIGYVRKHGVVNEDTDLDPFVHKKRLIDECRVYLYRSWFQKTGKDDKKIQDLLGEAVEDLTFSTAEAERLHPMPIRAKYNY